MFGWEKLFSRKGLPKITEIPERSPEGGLFGGPEGPVRF